MLINQGVKTRTTEPLATPQGHCLGHVAWDSPISHHLTNSMGKFINTEYHRISVSGTVTAVPCPLTQAGVLVMPCFIYQLSRCSTASMQNVFVMLNIDCVLIAVAFRRGRALAMGSAPNTQHVSTRTRRHTRTHARIHTNTHSHKCRLV